MELLVVGSGAAYPDQPGTASSTYVVTHGDDRICLDLGQGGFAGLAGRLEPSTLRAVVISHLHPDHFIDLVALRHYLRYEFEPPRRVRVLAPAGLAGRLDGLLAEPGFAAEALDIEGRREGTIRVGPFVLESRLVTHTDESYAVRVSLAAAPAVARPRLLRRLRPRRRPGPADPTRRHPALRGGLRRRDPSPWAISTSTGRRSVSSLLRPGPPASS